MSSQEPKIEQTVVPGGALVKISGILNEYFRPDMLAGVVQESVVIDLDQVPRITSFGVRQWINALNSLPARNLAFINCRPAVVAQFNMVSGFGSHGRLVSLYLPHVCFECDEEFEVLADLRTEYDRVTAEEPPSMKCKSCGATAELDEPGYLSYVASEPPPFVPDIVSKLIDGDLAQLTTRSFKIKKEVAGDVTAMWLSGAITPKVRVKRAALGLEGTVVTIFHGVTEVDPAAVDRLKPLFRNKETDTYFARLRPETLQMLAEHYQAQLQGRVVSFVLPVSCQGCGRSETVVRQFPEPGIAVSCHQCGRQAFLAAPRETKAQLASYYCPEPPRGVLAYLRERHHGPTLEGTGSRVTSRGPSGISRYTEAYRESQADDRIGRYEIVKRIGAGGMAQVFLATQKGPQGFEKKVVIKKILPRLAQDPSFVEMFLQEARLAARISHPNVVQVFELGDMDDEYFIAMEYVKGWSLDVMLRALARNEEQFPIDLACRLVADVCAGLHAAHTCGEDGRGIVHRDMSPHNILVSEQGAVKIVDFGISKAADSGSETKTGALKGKVVYMAPEQIDKSFGEIDQRTDVLATGLVLFETLTGKAPLKRKSEYASLKAAIDCEIPDVRSLRADVPAAVASIISRATAKAQDERYPSCRAFQLDLENVIAASGRTTSSVHLAQWLERFAENAVKAGRLQQAGGSNPSMRETVSQDLAPSAQNDAVAETVLMDNQQKNSY